MPRPLQRQMCKGSEFLSSAVSRSRLLVISVVTQMRHRPRSGRATGVLPPPPFTVWIPAPYSQETEQAPVTISEVVKGAPPGLANASTPQAPSNGADISILTASCPSAMSLAWGALETLVCIQYSSEHPQVPCSCKKCSCARTDRNIILAQVTMRRMAWQDVHGRYIIETGCGFSHRKRFHLLNPCRVNDSALLLPIPHKPYHSPKPSKVTLTYVRVTVYVTRSHRTLIFICI